MLNEMTHQLQPADVTRPVTMERTLGLWKVTASGVGIIVGAGIYVLIGDAAGLAGPRVWLSFVIAATLSALSALSYAELASMYPKAGAEFEYTSHVFPAWLSFLIGWIMFVGLIVASAAVALGFGQYLQNFVTLPPTFGALALLTLIAALALSGIRRSSTVIVALSLLQVGGLLLVIAVGLPDIGSVNLFAGNHGGGGLVSAAALVFFAFIGFDEVTTLSEETKNPTRTIPRALLLALALSTLLYIAVAISAVSVLGANALSTSPHPLADVLDHKFGSNGGALVAVIALVATANTTLLCLTASSRLQYGMARAGALPRTWGQLGPASRAPRVAIGISVIGAAIFIAIGKLDVVASVTNVAIYLVFIAVNIAVIILRFTQPDLDRPFRSPLSIKRVPLMPILGLLAVFLMFPSLPKSSLVLGAVLCLVGIAVYFVSTGRRSAQRARLN